MKNLNDLKRETREELDSRFGRFGGGGIGTKEEAALFLEETLDRFLDAVEEAVLDIRSPYRPDEQHRESGWLEAKAQVKEVFKRFREGGKEKDCTTFHPEFREGCWSCEGVDVDKV
jgi:hypothetical protein